MLLLQAEGRRLDARSDFICTQTTQSQVTHTTHMPATLGHYQMHLVSKPLLVKVQTCLAPWSALFVV